ncbi:Thymidylate synthase [Acinetobacter phage MD-2021a]|nr:Thymidylate synthase [Acinetobacter phage MD-2021a]CAH1068700.1 Thymidylate synthase [Acinetobacter phage MD-2021a]
MTKYILASTFEEAFKRLNYLVITEPEFVTDSRIGKCREIGSILLEVALPGIGATFKDKRINRIDYGYAEKFWEFMIQGGTDAEQAFKEYPNVAKFIAKPKTDTLPSNFNTFYGPRIVAQMPALIKELKEKPNSRRVVFQILQEQDQVLLDSDETLEYPCTDSITFYIREGLLYMHTHMRSQNCAVVMQLDFYLMHRFMEHVAKECGVGLGTYAHSIVSAHVFERDIEYVKSFLEE